MALRFRNLATDPVFGNLDGMAGGNAAAAIVKMWQGFGAVSDEFLQAVKTGSF